MRSHNTQIISYLADYNQIDELEKAIESGADTLKICVRACYEGELVISENPVWDTQLSALQEMGTLTLVQFFTLCNNRISLIVEIGSRERIVSEVIADIKGYRGSVALASASLITASTAQVLMSELPIQLICLEEGREVEWVRLAYYYGFSTVNIPFSAFSHHVVEQADDLEMDVNVFTVDAVGHARSLVEQGVCGIFTNNPRLLKEKL